ncbi:MAG: cytochrome c oxidase subunit 3, partial [Pseudomonadota bacterium]
GSSHDGEHADHEEHFGSHPADGGEASFDAHHPDPSTLSRDVGIFFSIYYCMTGLHAIHIIAGIIALAWVYWRCLLGHWRTDYFGPVDYVGLYWHLVDLIWIYLFPLLYLID